MQLLLLLIIAGVVGYFLSRSRYSNKIDQTTDNIAQSSSNLVGRGKNWWQDRFGRKNTPNSFVDWATGDGASHFPIEFRDWLITLTPNEANRFTNSLATYTQGLNYKLDDLTSGKLDNQPAKMQLFVEAVVVYSNEYRKALQAQSEKQAEDDNASEEAGNDGKVVAEKQPSRRKGAVGDTPEPSTAA